MNFNIPSIFSFSLDKKRLSRCLSLAVHHRQVGAIFVDTHAGLVVAINVAAHHAALGATVHIHPMPFAVADPAADAASERNLKGRKSRGKCACV